MGTDVLIETTDGRYVEDLPTCRHGGFELYQDLGLEPYQGMVYPVDTVYKLVKSHVETLDRDVILQMYLDEEFAYPKSVLNLYRILHNFNNERESVKYQIRFH